jgi:hypothetical protein
LKPFEMSGIEIVGVVLGAIPLIVDVLKAYPEGKRMFRRGKSFSIPLRSLIADVTAEIEFYKEYCRQLLDSVVSEAQREKLMKNPGSEGWKDEDLQDKLAERLGDFHKHFVSKLYDMNSVIDDIKSELDWDGGDRVSTGEMA